MGFFKKMFEEAGRKTGSAIGNRLFPKYTDYIRIGDLGDSQEERLEMEYLMDQERRASIEQSNLMQALLDIHFDSSDIDHNINALTKISAIIDSLPGWIQRSEKEHKIYKMAKSMMTSGIAICNRIDPGNTVIVLFSRKYLKNNQ